MSGPLEGIRVLEVAMYGFVPSAGAVLAEWGADVIKVEHAVTGDPQRGLRQTGSAEGGGRPEPQHRTCQPRQARHRSRHVQARGTRGAPRTRQAGRRLPDQLPAGTPQEVRHRRRRHPRGEPEDHLRQGKCARSARRRVGEGRLRHDRLLVPRRHRRDHHTARHRGHDRAAGTGLRRHHLRHQPGRRDRGRTAQARAHRRAVDGRRLAARQRSVGDGAHHRVDLASQSTDDPAAAGRARLADQSAGGRL